MGVQYCCTKNDLATRIYTDKQTGKLTRQLNILSQAVCVDVRNQQRLNELHITGANRIKNAHNILDRTITLLRIGKHDF